MKPWPWQRTSRSGWTQFRPCRYLSSIVALAVGVVLAVGVSALFALLGWGGELASQTAGAASGAAPLLIDGVRQRAAQQSRPTLRALTRGLFFRPKLFIASAFGFAVLLLTTCPRC